MTVGTTTEAAVGTTVKMTAAMTAGASRGC
jgi:hypothetical protein